MAAGIALIFGALVTTAIGGPGPGQERPLRASLAAEPGPYFVGQGIAVRLEVVAGSEPPTVTPPALGDADLTPIGSSRDPVMVSGIGTVVDEVVRYRWTYRIVARNAGRLLIPAFRVEGSGRIGSSPPLRLEIRPVPAAGRPSGFFGSVGPLAIEAEATPARLQLGDEFRYVLKLTGPGALGLRDAPPLGALVRWPAGVRVRPGDRLVQIEPPAVRFAYQVRPQAPGRLALAPPRLSTFDPRSGRFATVAGRSLSIEVAAVPRFDPGRVRASARAAAGTGRSTAIGLGLLVTCLLGISVWAWRRWRRRPVAADRWLKHEARRLDCSGRWADPATIPRLLAGYLGRAGGRPEGELTPHEARQRLLDLGWGPQVAESGARLVAACDEARFGGRSSGEATAERAGMARSVLDVLARGRGGRVEEGGRPAGGVGGIRRWRGPSC